MLDVNLARALELFAQPKGRGRRSQVVRSIGEHPQTKNPVEILEGPYGLYVKHEKTNATIPKDRKPEDLTMDEALKLLAEREAMSPRRGGGPRAKSAKKSAKKAGEEKPVGSRTEAKLARVKKAGAGSKAKEK